MARAEKLRIADWVELTVVERAMTLTIKEDAQTEAAKLDGCYAENRPDARASTQRDGPRPLQRSGVCRAGLSTCKTAHLEVRPIFLRREERTRAHALW